MKRFLITCLAWLLPVIPWCKTHRKWEGWNGFNGYVCSDCAETPEYRHALDEFVVAHP